MSTALLAVFGAAYAALLLAAAVALRRVPRPSGQPAGPLPPAAVVVPARDEEGNITACLDGLAAQEYPGGPLQIIVVDDGSADRTRALASGRTADLPRLAVLPLERTPDTLPGKTGALTAGIAAAGGDLVLLTDADCRVPPGWAAGLASAFADPRVALAAGFTIPAGDSLFARLQAIDWLFLVSLAGAGNAAGLPLTAVGTNLAVRRSAYDAAGGFPALPFSVTEDFRLFRALVGDDARRACFLLTPDAAVTTAPCGRWSDLLRQKRRWFLGGVDMGPLRIALFLLLAGFHLLLVLLLPAAPGAVAAAAAGKTLCDALLLLPALRTFGRLRLLPLLPLFELYLTAYVILIPLLLAVRPRVVWKGRTVRNARAPRGAGGLAG